MEQTNHFKRIEKLGEIVVAIVIVFGLIIIQLPITPPANKPLVYGAALFAFVFTFIWHKIKVPVSTFVKYYTESIVDLLIIAVVVHATGGPFSYFNFLYFLPNIDAAITTNKRFTLIFWLLTSSLIFAEILLFPPQNPSINPVSLGVLTAWSVGLVTVYGSYLAKEVKTAQGQAINAVTEKEKAINKLKDEFLFIIAHELRGPITVIRGYLELLLTGGVGEISPGIRSLSASAFRQSNHLNNLIAELLELSRLETEKIKFSNENFEINEFLGEALKEVKDEAEEKKIKFTFSPAQNGTNVFADKERVREIIIHLVENAFKHTGQFGQVWVGVNNQVNKVNVSVADTGVGYSPAELKSLFEKFHRHEDPDGKDGDTGLGLYLIKQLIEKMGGQLFAESQVGKGTNFTFSLPTQKLA